MMEFLKTLVNYIHISSPFLIFGLFFAGVINSFLSGEKFRKILFGNKYLSVVKAALFGIPLPLCSCAVIPTAATLKKNGVNNGATSSFLISTPESGIDSIAMTYAMMDFPMTLFRPVAAFMTAFIAGFMQLFFNPHGGDEEIEEKKSCCGSKTKEEAKPSPWESFTKMLKFSYGKLSNDLAFWLAVGLLAGAMIDFFVPQSVFENLAGFSGRLLILLITVPMYICASATTPIAASLIAKGMSPGMALIILLVGPATNISNILVIQKYIGKKGVLINIASIVIVSLICSYAVDYFYSSREMAIQLKLHHHDSGPGVLEYICSTFLVILIAKGIYLEKIASRFKKA